MDNRDRRPAGLRVPGPDPGRTARPGRGRSGLARFCRASDGDDRALGELITTSVPGGPDGTTGPTVARNLTRHRAAISAAGMWAGPETLDDITLGQTDLGASRDVGPRGGSRSVGKRRGLVRPRRPVAMESTRGSETRGIGSGRA